MNYDRLKVHCQEKYRLAADTIRFRVSYKKSTIEPKSPFLIKYLLSIFIRLWAYVKFYAKFVAAVGRPPTYFWTSFGP